MNGKKAKMLRRGLHLGNVPRITNDTPVGTRLVPGHPRAAYRASKRMYIDRVGLRAFIKKAVKGG